MAKEISYKQALEELQSLAHQIESDEPDIDELAGMVKRAKELIKICKTKLKKTGNEIDTALSELDD